MSRPLPVATIEIFRDIDSGNLDVSPMREGVEQINDITGGLEVVNDARRIRIATASAREVTPKSIRWPKFVTDMAIILTHRSICNPGSDVGLSGLNSRREDDPVSDIRLTGVALRRASTPVSIVTKNEPPLLAATTAHELAHLFGLKARNGVEPAISGHCNNTDCLMYPVGDVISRELSQEAVAVKSLTKHRRLRLHRPKTQVPHEPAFEYHRHNNTFCEECTKELLYQANLRAVKKLSSS